MKDTCNKKTSANEGRSLNELIPGCLVFQDSIPLFSAAGFHWSDYFSKVMDLKKKKLIDIGLLVFLDKGKIFSTDLDLLINVLLNINQLLEQR